MGKRGPAPKGEYAGKSRVLSTRIRPDTRKALELASKTSGRSLSQEIEHRLRRTFIEDEKIEAAFGGRQNFNIMRTVAMALHVQRGRLPDCDGLPHWLTDAGLFDQTVRMVGNVLSALRPLDAEPPPNTSPDRRQLLELFSEVLDRPPGADSKFSPLLVGQLNAVLAEVAAMDTWNLIDSAELGQQLNEGTIDDHRRGLLKADLEKLLPRTRKFQKQEWKRELVRIFNKFVHEELAKLEKDEDNEG